MKINGIDLNEFQAQRHAVVAAISERTEAIQKLLGEIKAISQATGVSVSLRDLKYQMDDTAERDDSDWNSSSYHC